MAKVFIRKGCYLFIFDVKNKKIRITYPRFWQTPQGNLQFCYRRGGSGNGDRMLVDYNAITGSIFNL